MSKLPIARIIRYCIVCGRETDKSYAINPYGDREFVCDHCNEKLRKEAGQE